MAAGVLIVSKAAAIQKSVLDSPHVTTDLFMVHLINYYSMVGCRSFTKFIYMNNVALLISMRCYVCLSSRFAERSLKYTNEVLYNYISVCKLIDRLDYHEPLLNGKVAREPGRGNEMWKICS